MEKKILIVDDEEDILEIISYNLEHSGFLIETARDGLEAIKKARNNVPDLILLDIMMPKMTGIDVINLLKQDPTFNNTFIILLTALGSEQSEVEGLNAGADDYIIKPIKPKILLSRINTVLRRRNTKVEDVLKVGSLKIDKERYEVTLEDIIIDLTIKEFKLLELLASKPGRVFTRVEIFDLVWKDESIVGDRTIDVHIRRIRQKLNSGLITTIKGVGYKIEVPS